MVFSEPYAQVYDRIYAEKPYESEVAFVLERLSAHGMTSGGQVHDLGCGTGRHLEVFAKNGWQIEGSDRSPGMVAEAKKRVGDRITESSMVDVEIKNAQLVTAFFGTLGYLSPQEQRDLFARLATAVQPGSFFFADIWEASRLLPGFAKESVAEWSDKESVVTRSTRARDLSKRRALEIDFETRVHGKGEDRTFNESHVVHYFDRSEVLERLEESGWYVREMGSFPDGGRNGRSFYFLAQREATS